MPHKQHLLQGNHSEGQWQRQYLGVSQHPSRERYNNHTKAFRSRRYEKDTELSKLIWKLTDAGEQHTLSWSIALSVIPYKCGGSCDLSATKKLLIIMAAPGSIINKRDEVVSKCHHKNKHILKWLKWPSFVPLPLVYRYLPPRFLYVFLSCILCLWFMFLIFR